ncbi:TRAP transporter large permease [Marinimicrobium agarilyticum]|uniref:TRAP transporter large permease n=1 Tax=Marinimicrobium TaxID=359337 RepID=UPI00041BC08F|nr:TRAP transporter large permease [Marinimicrobium agarilyticum]
MMILLLVLVLLFALILSGAPVYVALGLSSLAYFLSEGIAGVAAAHTMIGGLDSFTLSAIPFFILAGHLMNAAGFTERIFAFARALVGWAPGGLGHVNIGASVVFAGMSGAAVADAGGLGAVEIKAMRDAGYERGFSVGVTAASSTIGPIIPPSLPLIVYGVVAEVSIGRLFAAGLLPGLIMAIALMVMVHVTAVRRGFRREAAFSVRFALRAAKSAILPLLTPIIIVGGIVCGVFTPTEAAIAAVAFTMLVGCVLFRTLRWRAILDAMVATVETTASVLMIVASAALFAWVLTANQVADGLASGLLAMTSDKTAVLLLIMAIVFVVGFFMETIAAITILAPLVLPVALSVGIDPVHLGVVFVLNLMIGLLTPPVGMVLYVLAKVSRTPFEECVRATLPFLVPLFGVLLLLVFVPEIALYLPGLLFED